MLGRVRTCNRAAHLVRATVAKVFNNKKLNIARGSRFQNGENTGELTLDLSEQADVPKKLNIARRSRFQNGESAGELTLNLSEQADG